MLPKAEVEPNAGLDTVPKAEVEPKAGVDVAPNEGVMDAPKAGVDVDPNEGVVDAPKAGVEGACDGVSFFAGAVEAVPGVIIPG